MAYRITGDDINAIRQIDEVFGTTKLLPAPADIPDAFYQGNIYTRIAEAMFFGSIIPEGRVVLFDDVEPEALNRCTEAHLRSFGPKHEDKIAGVGYMLSQLCEIHAPARDPV